MTVGDLLKALADVPPENIVWVEGCEAGRCFSTVRSVEIESGREGNRHLPIRVTLTRDIRP